MLAALGFHVVHAVEGFPTNASDFEVFNFTTILVYPKEHNLIKRHITKGLIPQQNSAMFNRPRVLTSVAQSNRLPSSVRMLKGDLRKEACKKYIVERLSKLPIVSCGADCYFSIQSDALMLLKEGVAAPSVAW